MKIDTSAAIFIAALTCTSCSGKQPATTSQLELLGKACQAQMVSNTCQAMKPSIVRTPKSGEVVFVAGVGPVDAQLLARLSAAGEAMCAEVKASCANDWKGNACIPLKKMYAPNLP
jgi:hypothetical protein